jgi:hypothetical protein
MMFLIGAFILWKFEAGFVWWIAYAALVAAQIWAILYNAYKAKNEVEVSPLLKANGQPYTEADLEFIWKHGYQSAIEVVTSTKQ